MNLELFDKFMNRRRIYRPAQQPYEWKVFLQLCEVYLKSNDIKNPIVVELGVYYGEQKKFYEKLLGAKYIGIDRDAKRSVPDIIGDTRDPKTLKALKAKLRGRAINILFIDGDHTYGTVKKDFEMYSSLCNDIVAFHDIESGRYEGNRKKQVFQFWDELKELSYIKSGEYEDYLFISLRQRCLHRKMDDRLGIGVILKK